MEGKLSQAVSRGSTAEQSGQRRGTACAAVRNSCLCIGIRLRCYTPELGNADEFDRDLLACGVHLRPRWQWLALHGGQLKIPAGCSGAKAKIFVTVGRNVIPFAPFGV